MLGEVRNSYALGTRSRMMGRPVEVLCPATRQTVHRVFKVDEGPDNAVVGIATDEKRDDIPERHHNRGLPQCS